MSEEPRSKGKNGDAQERRGQAKQRTKRAEEYAVRIEAVKYLRCLSLEGETSGEVAQALAISPRTLRHWDLMERSGELRPLQRGRPLVRSKREDRNRVVAALEYFGPRTGVATIRRFASDIPRSEVRDIVVRYRERLKTRGEGVEHELRWRVPGAVEAFDHTVPPVLVDGSKPAILAGRDLATGEATVWEAVDAMTASTTVDLFRRSLADREPPLVVKTDNGSAFIAYETETLLGAYQIEHLLSPPFTPRYNGSAERHIGWMKIRTEWQALREGRVDTWTSDDLAAAQAAANATRPPIRFPPAPALTPELRAAFRATVAAERARLWAERGLDPTCATKIQRNQINRQAITHALVAHGILEVRSRRVSLPVRSLFLAKIT